MQEKNLRLLKDAAYAVGAPLDDKEVCRLAQFCDLVLDANRLFNLTAITNEEEFAVKHIADSLSALPYLGRGKDAWRKQSHRNCREGGRGDGSVFIL